MRVVFTLNKVLLFDCTSMYFGTGWSLVLFSFPIAPELTPDTYFIPFVSPVQAATEFFTIMTMVMMGSCILFIIGEWRTKRKWYPIVILVLVILATLLTIFFIFDYNAQMGAGITDADTLREVLDSWMTLNTIRVSIWTVQWLTMALYFFNIDLKINRIHE